MEKVEADIIQNGAPVEFKDIAGLEFAKKCVTEMVCWPMCRPDLFQGLRSLPKGLLLFGPPGTASLDPLIQYSYDRIPLFIIPYTRLRIALIQVLVRLS